VHYWEKKNKGGRTGVGPYSSRNFVNPMDEWGFCECTCLRECNFLQRKQ